jgi:hypothetical protein
MNRVYRSSGHVTLAVLVVAIMTGAAIAAPAETGTYSSITIEVDEHEGVVIIEENGDTHEHNFSVRDQQ